MRRRARAVAFVTALVALTGACGVRDAGVTVVDRATGPNDTGPNDTGPNDTGPNGTGPDGPTGGSLIPSDPVDTALGATTTIEPTYTVQSGVVDFGEAGPQHPAYDGFLTSAFDDIQAFWNDAFPAAYGSPFTSLAGGIFAAYPSRTAPIPGCGKPQSTYADVAEGTAFYCVDGDFIAYDDAKGLPDLVQQLGKEAVAVVLAHEFGHAIQSRAKEWDQPGILKEQQADCFAGAWAAHAASGAGGLVRFNDTDVRAGLVAMIQVADPVVGAGLDDPLAHGTGFDRVGAFQDGFQGGVARCTTFFTEDRVSKMIDIPFDRYDRNQGNLPLVDPNPDAKLGPNDIVTQIPNSLDQFWTTLAQQNGVPFTAPKFAPFPAAGPLPSCPGIPTTAWLKSAVFCPTDNTIHWDRDEMARLAGDPLTGDMSVGYLFSDAFSDAIQNALRTAASGERRALTDDCLTGAWVASIVPRVGQPNDKLVLSAGDLDEAVITAISRSDPTKDTNINGSAFEKISAFRTGVLGGLNVCRSLPG
jgi:predicted metalloprotease